MLLTISAYDPTATPGGEVYASATCDQKKGGTVACRVEFDTVVVTPPAVVPPGKKMPPERVALPAPEVAPAKKVCPSLPASVEFALKYVLRQPGLLLWGVTATAGIYSVTLTRRDLECGPAAASVQLVKRLTALAPAA